MFNNGNIGTIGQQGNGNTQGAVNFSGNKKAVEAPKPGQITPARVEGGYYGHPEMFYGNGNIGTIGQQGNGNTQGTVTFSEDEKEETRMFNNGNIGTIGQQGNGNTQGAVNFSENKKAVEAPKPGQITPARVEGGYYGHPEMFYGNGNIGTIGQQGNGNTQGTVTFSEDEKEETRMFNNGNIGTIGQQGNGNTQGAVTFSADEKEETRMFKNGNIGTIGQQGNGNTQGAVNFSGNEKAVEAPKPGQITPAIVKGGYYGHPEMFYGNGNIGRIGQQGNGNTQGAVSFSEDARK